MSSLAEPINHNAAPQSWMDSVRGPNSVKAFIWAGLSSNTRKSFQTATKSYVYYTKFMGVITWPAKAEVLEEWIANRLLGSSMTMQGQVKPDTMASFLTALRQYHLDH